jgi:(R,R)-butanediol dehydrogenase / meso-butanediol dehydrogenase / diacetyl reductase
MKAAYYNGNKEFEVRESPLVSPGKGEVRLEVAYCGVCGTDMHIYHGVMDNRILPPQIIGHEASAVVAELGEGVVNVKVGDKVTVRPLYFGEQHPADRGYSHVGRKMKFIGIDSAGAFQQSWIVPAYTLHKLPDSLSLLDGSMIEPLSVACHCTKIGEVKKNDYCVVLGGGPIGILIAYVLKEKGANVIVSEINETRLELLNKLEFLTVNPTQEDLVERVSQFTNEAMADVVFEVSGSKGSVEIMTSLLCVRGVIVMVAIVSDPMKVNLQRFFWLELEMRGSRLYESEDFEEAIRIAEKGVVPFNELITTTKSLSDIQKLFEEIDNNPVRMKSLVDCRQ